MLNQQLRDFIIKIGSGLIFEKKNLLIEEQLKILKSETQKQNISEKQFKEIALQSITIYQQGYDISFILHKVLLFIESKNLQYKCLAYYLCSLILTKNDETLILLVNSLHKDLLSSDKFVVANALNILTQMINPIFVQYLHMDILRLVEFPNAMIRKKTLLVIQAMRRQQIDVIEEHRYDQIIIKALHDKDPQVMEANLSLIIEALNQGRVEQFKNQLPTFKSILTQIHQNRLSQYQYHYTPAPWIQMKLIEIFGYLGENDGMISEELYEILGTTLKFAQEAKNIPIIFQAIKAMTQIQPYMGLLEEASLSVAQLLENNKNSNSLYVGLKCINLLSQIDLKFINNQQQLLLELLKRDDISIQRQVFKLIIKLINKENFSLIVQDLIHYLQKTEDKEYQKLVVNEIKELYILNSANQDEFHQLIKDIL